MRGLAGGGGVRISKASGAADKAPPPTTVADNARAVMGFRKEENMVTVRVLRKESGKAAKSARVSIGFSGLFRGVTGNEYTVGNGDAHFDTDSGHGKVFVNGSTVHEGSLKGRVVFI